MLIGYARVSTGLQNSHLQMDALTQYGCSKILYVKMSGAKRQRLGLEEALQYAREGDTIVVWRLDRLGRNMQDLIQIVNSLNERGVGFHSLQENLTMEKSNATGQLGNRIGVNGRVISCFTVRPLGNLSIKSLGGYL